MFYHLIIFSIPLYINAIGKEFHLDLTVTDKSGATNTFTSDTSAIPYPLAVIINENTVCEAEVFAKALFEDTSTNFEDEE